MSFGRIAIAALLLFGPLRADDSEDERKTLKGIKSVSVVVEDLSPDAVNDGLTIDQIKTDIELRLRKAGISVVPLTQTTPALDIYAHLVRVDTFYIYGLHLNLIQDITVKANRASLYVPTWYLSSLAHTGRENVVKDVRGDIGDLVDRFLNAFLSMNPRAPTY